jgi:hypothetical protein
MILYIDYLLEKSNVYLPFADIQYAAYVFVIL